jgi:hypothetical protein
MWITRIADYPLRDGELPRTSFGTIVQYRKVMPHVDDAREDSARARAGTRHVLYNDVRDGY